MKDLEQQLQKDGSQQRADFSHERHVALMASLADAPMRAAEAPLRGLPEYPYVGTAIAVAAITFLGVVLLDYRSTETPQPDGFSTPMRVAENSIQRIQTAASKISSDPSAPLLKQADDVFTYFAKQVSLAESLAVKSERRSRT